MFLRRQDKQRNSKNKNDSSSNNSKNNNVKLGKKAAMAGRYHHGDPTTLL